MNDDVKDWPQEELNHFEPGDYSPYRFFSAERWAEFRDDTPLTLNEDEVERLRQLAGDANLDPDFAEKFLNFIVREVIRHHEAIAAEAGN